MTLQADLQRVCATGEDLAAVQGSGEALALALPSTTDEVAAVLRTCAQAGVGVTVRGGGTGGVGGAEPHGTVVLSTRRLDRIGPVEDGSVVAGAGITVAQVQQRARRAGWDYGVDVPERDRSTVGGTVATDAGGTHVLAHGTTGAQVLGLEGVLADGTVVGRTSGLSGHDLSRLLVGSEGTLGVITAVRLRLVPLAATREVALVACPSVRAAVELVDRARGRATGLRAAELAGLAGLAAGLTPDAAAYVLLEAESGLARAVTGLDAVLAQDEAGAAELWGLAEAGGGVDVTVPRAQVAALLEALPPGAQARGHLGHGNLQVSGVDVVLELAAGLGGGPGTEHGVGRRSLPQGAAVRAVKAALDPTGLLNPGVLS